MRQIVLRNQQGAMLIELVTAALLGLIIIGGLCSFFRQQLFHNLAEHIKNETMEDARGALDIITRDLKNAGSWGSGAVPPETAVNDDPDGDPDLLCNRVYAASADLLHVQMDLNGNNTCADTDPRENIRYEIAGPTDTCPGTKTIRRNGDCLVSNIRGSPGGKLFRYFNSAGVELGDAPALAAIKRVRIAFAVEAKHPDPKVGGTITAELSTTVELRN